MPAQVLLALLQIRVPQSARERAKHLDHDVNSRASGLPCNAVMHTVVACPQRLVYVGARSAYPMPIHRAVYPLLPSGASFLYLLNSSRRIEASVCLVCGAWACASDHSSLLLQLLLLAPHPMHSCSGTHFRPSHITYPLQI
jgi:hypothetical protein